MVMATLLRVIKSIIMRTQHCGTGQGKGKAKARLCIQPTSQRMGTKDALLSCEAWEISAA